ARLAARFARMLEATASEPGRRLDAVDLLAPAERHEILVEWSGAAAHDTDDRDAVHLLSLIAAQVAQAPDIVAIVMGEQHVTYETLWRRSRRLAAVLTAKGVRPEMRVAIGLERSIDAVVAMLGVLHAGACYVPLDLNAPAKRLAFVLESAQCVAMLTRE